jgi:histidine triad (HIT) family protein
MLTIIKSKGKSSCRIIENNSVMLNYLQNYKLSINHYQLKKRGEFMDCIFCKIAEGEIPSKKLYEDEKVIAFYDISPEAPIHFLVIPKKHIKSVNEVNEENANIISHIFLVINKLVKELNIAETGYRIVNNCGKDGGQTVDHMHFHVLGQRELKWPPG